MLPAIETIAAISTPAGAGGIGIIRMSGPRALDILRQIFHPSTFPCPFRSHQLYYGHILAPQDRSDTPDNRSIIDEVLVVYMQAPRTYTREDVVEIHAHGNFLVLQSILEILLRFPVRLAEPGEFTRRAFLGGRIDLTRAEAVIDILSARTRKGLSLAQSQLSGSLYNQVDAIRQALVHMRAIIEVAIDFPDEDIDIIDHKDLLHQLDDGVIIPLTTLLRHAEQGKIFREGISVVIAGLPNAGKSSLLNALLQEERALVTAIPGTTRDTIEEFIDILGIPVRLVDTAGIRENAEEVEQLGIERAKNRIQQADLVLFMVDLERGIHEEDRELFRSLADKPTILVANKADLPGTEKTTPQEISDTPVPWVRISARKQDGIDTLKQTIFQAATEGRGQWEEAGCAPNLRHKDAMIRARNAAERVQAGLQEKLTCDLVAIDLQECLAELDAIVGTTTTEDILDRIFQQFCLGK